MAKMDKRARQAAIEAGAAHGEEARQKYERARAEQEAREEELKQAFAAEASDLVMGLVPGLEVDSDDWKVRYDSGQFDVEHEKVLSATAVIEGVEVSVRKIISEWMPELTVRVKYHDGRQWIMPELTQATFGLALASLD